MIRLLPRITIIALCVLSWAQPAAADTYEVSGPTDFYFTVEASTTINIATDAQRFGIDSMIWLYRENILIAENDDAVGLDSRLSVAIEPGTYRLRAGVCCFDPNRWYGSSYQLTTNLIASQPTTSTSTTVEETTTTTSTTTTTIVETATSTTTTTLPEETTTTWASSTTTTELTTTTTAPTTTDAPTTTAMIVETTIGLPPVETAPSTTEQPTTTSAPTVVATTTSTPSRTTTTTTVVTSGTTSSAPTTTAVPSTTVQTTATSVITEEPEVTTTLVENYVIVNGVAQPTEDAPASVKREFESSVNIFDGLHDDYVPLGSKISVAERRVLTASSVTLGVIPITPRRRR